MNLIQPWQSYRQTSVETASPGRLIVMLYEGAVRYLEQALTGFNHSDPLEFNQTINNNVLRAQGILQELNWSLDMERGGQLAQTLRRLYLYMDRRLTESNRTKTPEGIEDTVRRLSELRDAWREMLSQSSDASEGEAAPTRLWACG